ncbi:MAG: glutamyl-tRNA reductase [Chloroflexi bacterium RBG_16_60_22]|nr:MAG: glutamyl-tRNA reductase [Chloroflexi bacterium RBG_16_60_22]
MDICLVGINHRTAPVAIREKAAVRSGKLDDALRLLGSRVPHGVILSTCNRTEVYTISDSDGDTEEASLDFLRNHLEAADTVLFEHTYVRYGQAAVEHLFRTASGLDSMVLGEYEVLGQVRQALEIAEKAGMVSLPLRHVFQSAIRTGRRVRDETGISKNAFSVSSVAVDLASKIVGRLEGCKMLVIGAGEAGRLVAKAARDRGVSRIVIASRTRERAAGLTEMLGGIPISLNDIEEELDTCNIIVTCADAPHCILDVPQLVAPMQRRPGTPLVIIDIAVPRNVAPAVTQIKNVFLYNIDDLSRISDKNCRQRRSEVKEAEDVVAAELAKFTSWWQDFKVRPLIRAMMSKAEEIRRSHLDRTVKKLPPLSDEELYSLEMMTRGIIARLLKDPIHVLKANGHDNHEYAEMLKELFQLNIESNR